MPVINRLAKLNTLQSQARYAKRGILFSTPTVQKLQDTIDLYNHGFPEKASQNTFKIFDTGDAFSVVLPEVELNGVNVNIHVGVNHQSYSPLVLLHEALQLCRCASEHGAKEVTIALPEQYHPMLNPNDFNMLLLNFFKVSGAGSVYFYDQQYQGKISENIETLFFQKEAVLDYLQWKPEGALDERIAHHMRRHSVTRVVSQFEMDHRDVEKLLSEDIAPANIQVPAMENAPHIVLCCSANQAFAKEVAESLTAHGETVKIYYLEGNAELSTIPSDAEICGAKVTIVQSTRPNPDDITLTHDYKINGSVGYFYEAMMIARQAHLRGSAHVNLVDPYQFNARSDKAEDNIKGKTGAYVQLNGALLEAAGVNHVITAECHDPHTLSGKYTGKKIKGSAVQALTLISKKIAEHWLQSSDEGQFRLVKPDAGAAKRTKELAQTLKPILGKRLCESEVLGQKERGSHDDDSAKVTNLNSGNILINAKDKYVITDDETATGKTLCDAILNLKSQGAEDISVVVVHNNMPIDWLLRQLSLARFIYAGVSDLHFSNTQEMGTLAKIYEDLIQTYSRMNSSSATEVETQVADWFKENVTKFGFGSSFDSFKNTFSELSSRVIVHNLADSFVDKFTHKMKVQLASVQTQSVFAANTLFAAGNGGANIVDIHSQKITQASGLRA
jgi:phosphoribosylpyrophosphate synthetase